MGRFGERIVAVGIAYAKALRWDKHQGIREAQRGLAEL